MNTIIKFATYAGITSLALACGGQLLAPQWERPYEGNIHIAQNPDDDTLWVSRIQTGGDALVVETVDQAGNLLTTRSIENLPSYRYIPVHLTADIVYLDDLRYQTGQHLLANLSTGTTTAAFPASFTEQYRHFDPRVVDVQADGDLILAGTAQSTTDLSRHYIIVRLQPSGEFNMHVEPRHSSSQAIRKLGNATGYVSNQAWQTHTGDLVESHSYLLYMDDNLNEVSRVEMDAFFTLLQGFNDRAYGSLMGDDGFTRIFVDLEGNQLPIPDTFATATRFYHGENVFYTSDTPYERQSELCRYDYTLTQLGCFTVHFKGDPRIVVTPDDGIGLIENFNVEIPIGVGISLDDIDGDLLAAGSIMGTDTTRYHYRTFNADGQLILNATAQTYREQGPYHICEADYWPIPCLQPNQFDAGVCSVGEALFLNTRELISEEVWCKDSASRHQLLRKWQP